MRWRLVLHNHTRGTKLPRRAARPGVDRRRTTSWSPSTPNRDVQAVIERVKRRTPARPQDNNCDPCLGDSVLSSLSQRLILPVRGAGGLTVARDSRRWPACVADTLPQGRRDAGTPSFSWSPMPRTRSPPKTGIDSACYPTQPSRRSGLALTRALPPGTIRPLPTPRSGAILSPLAAITCRSRRSHVGCLASWASTDQRPRSTWWRPCAACRTDERGHPPAPIVRRSRRSVLLGEVSPTDRCRRHPRG